MIATLTHINTMATSYLIDTQDGYTPEKVTELLGTNRAEVILDAWSEETDSSKVSGSSPPTKKMASRT